MPTDDVASRRVRAPCVGGFRSSSSTLRPATAFAPLVSGAGLRGLHVKPLSMARVCFIHARAFGQHPA